MDKGSKRRLAHNISKDLFGVAKKCRFCSTVKFIKIVKIDCPKSPIFSVMKYWRDNELSETVYACSKCSGIFRAVNDYFILSMTKASTVNPIYCAICGDKKRNMSQYKNSALLTATVLQHLNIIIKPNSSLYYCNTCIIRLDQLHRLYIKMIDATNGRLSEPMKNLGGLKLRLVEKKPGTYADEKFEITPKKKPARKVAPTASVRAGRVLRQQKGQSTISNRPEEICKSKAQTQSRVSGRPEASRKSKAQRQSRISSRPVGSLKNNFGIRAHRKQSLPRVSVARKSIVFRPSTKIEGRVRYPRAAAAPKPQAPRRVTRLALKELSKI